MDNNLTEENYQLRKEKNLISTIENNINKENNYKKENFDIYQKNDSPNKNKLKNNSLLAEKLKMILQKRNKQKI